MSFTFPRESNVRSEGFDNRNLLTIQIDDIIKCEYGYNHYTIETEVKSDNYAYRRHYHVYVSRLPEFEALFLVFPYTIKDLKQEFMKKLLKLEHNMEKILPIIETILVKIENVDI